MNYKKLTGKVEYCLNKYEETRNSDTKLCNAVLYEFYRDNLFLDYRNKKEGDLAVRLKDMYNLPKFEDICRIRRKFQEKLKYCATKGSIAEGREKKRLEVREFLGYKN